MTQHKPAAHVLTALMGDVWAITDSGFARLCEIAARENVVTQDIRERIAQRKSAVAAQRGSAVENTRAVVRRGSVGVIGVVGPIVRYADIFAEISGACSVEALAMDFATAMRDPSIRDVMFTFHTPGGGVEGINEFAGQIAAARGKGKRIIGYIPIMCASAGYWFAAACDEIVIEASAEAGSIGIRVGATIPPPPKEDEARTIEVINTLSPRKKVDPDTPEGYAEMLAVADNMGQVFIDFVKAHRPPGVDLLGGGMAMGRDAVAAKLADRVGTFEGLIAELESTRTAIAPGRPMAATTKRRAVNNKGARAMSTTNAGPGRCSECACPEFTAMASDMNMCATCSPPHPNSSHANMEVEEVVTAEEPPAPIEPAPPAPDPDPADIKATLKEVLAKLATAETRAAAAELKERKATANAKVDTWMREGSLTGNSVEAGRKIYVAASTGVAVTAADIEAFVATLPKLGATAGQRIAATASKEIEARAGAPSVEDWRAHDTGDRNAKAKIDMYVKGLVTADAAKNGGKAAQNYVQHMTAARQAAFATK